MRKTYPLNRDENIVCLSSGVIYNQKPYWCNATARQMRLSFMSPRKHYDFDRREVQPCLVFVCGGGFEKQDINVWTPELSYFAKRGYSVAVVDYSVLPFTRWPEAIEDVKSAIRFLRAHAKEFWIDPDRIAIMGESAGGYLATLAAATGKSDLYNVGENLDVSTEVACCVNFWSGPDLPGLQSRPLLPGQRAQGVEQTEGAPNAADYFSKDTPPFISIVGLEDKGAYGGVVYLSEKLEQAGVEHHEIFIEGAGHADAGCVNSAIKADILAFLDKHMNVER